MSARPDPDALLARLNAEDVARTRGRLRIYFGASAGVGKTFAMLLAGKRAAAERRDVLVGLVETHGRVETEALLAYDASGPALAILPRASIASDGPAFDEFDLDGALARRPALILVDELAHSNAAGSRHAKRWQDIDELLAAGIDVYTTLNVQHLESLNDVVGGITGVVVRETVPDTFFDRADEVVLVDLPADELLKRLAAGKVYLPAQAERAARNFFRKGNLIALREIALRRTADRVEDDVHAYRDERAIDTVWGTEAALLCCVGPGAGAERVVRAAGRLAGQLGVEWHAVYVETPRLQRLAESERSRILRVLALAQQLGAATAVLTGSDVAATTAIYAREHNLSRLVAGRAARRAWWQQLIASSFADRLAVAAPEIDLVVVGGREDAAPAPFPASDDPDGDGDDAPSVARRWIRFIGPTLIVAAVTVGALPLADWLHPTNIAMLYLLVVAFVAMRSGRTPAAYTAVISVSTFDFFFVPPRWSFAVSDVQYAVTLVVMLVIALSIGTLASNLRYQARVAQHREGRTRSLYEVARDLSIALRDEDVARVVERSVGELFRADVRVLLTSAYANGRRLAIDQALAQRAGFEPAIAQWAFERGEPAGAGTDTLAGSDWLFLPLATTMGARGVLAVRPQRRRMLVIPEQRRLLDTIAALTAIAIERTHYVDVAQGSLVKVESERLRNSILSALSHDLRTPIAALSGLTETLAMSPNVVVDDRALAEAARDEVRRMSALVENLLEMARIESGDVVPRRAWHAIEEGIGGALAATARLLAGHRVTTVVPRHLPLAEYDAVLIERVLYNLLENAAKYSPPDSTVLVEASAPPDALVFAVEDDGPGAPASFATAGVDALFDKFTRGVDESSASGVGLGLAICRAIVEAHGGRIAIAGERHLPPRDGRGFRVEVRLPRREAPPVDEAPLTDEPTGMPA